MRAAFLAPQRSRKYGCGPHIELADNETKPRDSTMVATYIATCRSAMSVENEKRNLLHAFRALNEEIAAWFRAQQRIPLPQPIMMQGKSPKQRACHLLGPMPTNSRSPQTGSEIMRETCVWVDELGDPCGGVNCSPGDSRSASRNILSLVIEPRPWKSSVL